jgi:hypothetical protein
MRPSTRGIIITFALFGAGALTAYEAELAQSIRVGP